MIIFALCIALLTSFMCIGMGFYILLKRGFCLFAPSDQLWRELLRWRVFGATSSSPQIVADIEKSWCYLRAMTAIGGGVGLLLMVISTVAISLAATGTVGGNTPDPFFFLAILYGSASLGFGMGGMFAVWRMRRAAKHKVTYADLRQRRLSDYRGRLLYWIPLMAIAETVAFSWFFAPHLGAMLRFFQSDGGTVDVQNSFWMLSIVPCAMVVVFIVAEFIMSRLAHLSRLLITSDPTVSQHADDMLRAIVIGMVQSGELIAVTYLGMVQNGLFVRSLWASSYWQIGYRPFHEISDISFNLLLLSQVLGLILVVVRGHLGGKLSGWPWQTKQVEQPGVEQ